LAPELGETIGQFASATDNSGEGLKMNQQSFFRSVSVVFLALAVFFVCANPSSYAACATDSNDCIIAGNEAVKKGDIDKAIEFYKKAASLDPKNINAINGLGHLYFQKGDKEAALKQYKIVKGMDKKLAAELDKAIQSM
jgi:tetratricopeptide (TPR) repeat protein